MMDRSPSREIVDGLIARRVIPAEFISDEINRSAPLLSLRPAFEASQLSAHEFADEVARGFKLPRASLAEMIGAQALGAQFSERFLRETGMYPFADEAGRLRLAMADPGDGDAHRAAELVLGAKPEIVVASFEDIASALTARLGEPEINEVVITSGPSLEENIDNLRDLASGAPVVQAFEAIVEKAVDLRASDIHIEPGRAGLTIRVRVDGVLRQIATPGGAPAAALISRLKILSGLNIAELNYCRTGRRAAQAKSRTR